MIWSPTLYSFLFPTRWPCKLTVFSLEVVDVSEAVFGSTAALEAILGSACTPEAVFGSTAALEVILGSACTPETVFGSACALKVVLGSACTPETVFGSACALEVVLGSTCTPEVVFGVASTTVEFSEPVPLNSVLPSAAWAKFSFPKNIIPATATEDTAILATPTLNFLMLNLLSLWFMPFLICLFFILL